MDRKINIGKLTTRHQSVSSDICAYVAFGLFVSSVCFVVWICVVVCCTCVSLSLDMTPKPQYWGIMKRIWNSPAHFRLNPLFWDKWMCCSPLPICHLTIDHDAAGRRVEWLICDAHPHVTWRLVTTSRCYWTLRVNGMGWFFRFCKIRIEMERLWLTLFMWSMSANKFPKKSLFSVICTFKGVPKNLEVVGCLNFPVMYMIGHIEQLRKIV